MFYRWIILHWIWRYLYISHIFFIHSRFAGHGHLSYFYNLAIVTNAAMNMGELYEVPISILLDIYTSIGFLDHIAHYLEKSPVLDAGDETVHKKKSQYSKSMHFWKNRWYTREVNMPLLASIKFSYRWGVTWYYFSICSRTKAF